MVRLVIASWIRWWLGLSAFLGLRRISRRSVAGLTSQIRGGFGLVVYGSKALR
jgi:hypothetical protein